MRSQRLDDNDRARDGTNDKTAQREQAPFCKTVVGGAVLTADYAAKIGADYYSKDAAATVRAAKEVYGRN